MPKRERGTGGLIKLKGCRYWYAQIYDRNGKQRRVSTKTDVKQEAQSVLRNLLVDKDRGVQFVGDGKKLLYEELRAALIQNYIERGNKSCKRPRTAQTIGAQGAGRFFEGLLGSQSTTDAALQSLPRSG
jgi:hypothetical protein